MKRILWIPFAALLAGPAAAANCSLDLQGVSFGTYSPFANQPLDSTGSVGVTCDSGTAYTISLSAGTGSHSVRRMAGAVDSLEYNLFTDASRSVVWGDGTGATGVVGGLGTGLRVNHSVYGRIAPRQNVRPGGYNDQITVTIDF